jgi:hypothetical protein
VHPLFAITHPIALGPGLRRDDDGKKNAAGGKPAAKSGERMFNPRIFLLFWVQH